MEQGPDPLAALLVDESGDVKLGHLLDVACGGGSFIHRLKALGSLKAVTGVERSAAAMEKARESLEAACITPFELIDADAHSLPFADDHFDTVSISVSLHHMASPQRVLGEMQRVLKPDGRLIVCEMLADGLSPAQQLHRELHHLSALADRAEGIVHSPTYRRRDLLDLLSVLDVDWRRIIHKPADWPLSALPELKGVFTVIHSLKFRLRKSGISPNALSRLERVEKKMKTLGWGWQSQLLAVGVAHAS
jgi:SAM-dependent methyltransferase